MNKFLAAIFGGRGRHPGNRVPVRQALQVRLGLQELSRRIVPSGCASGAASAGQAARAAQDHESVAAMTRSATADSLTGGRTCGGQAEATVAANLSNANGATGTALFDADSNALQVQVQGAATDTTIEVSVDGTSVGTLSTDAAGNGSAEFANVPVQAGSAITVGDLSGVFARSSISAALSGSSGARGSASFDSIQNELRVTVHAASPNSTFDVSIDGAVVGQITTNDSGSGKLVVSPATVIQIGSMIAILDSATDSSLLEGLFA
jgi:hypothetical protein